MNTDDAAAMNRNLGFFRSQLRKTFPGKTPEEIDAAIHEALRHMGYSRNRSWLKRLTAATLAHRHPHLSGRHHPHGGENLRSYTRPAA